LQYLDVKCLLTPAKGCSHGQRCIVIKNLIADIEGISDFCSRKHKHVFICTFKYIYVYIAIIDYLMAYVIVTGPAFFMARSGAIAFSTDALTYSWFLTVIAGA
jgi:hypothetical protein